jgi:hypothetical protein
VDACEVLFSVRRCFLTALLLMCPAIAQDQSKALPGYSVLAPEFSSQSFYCHTGYTVDDCRRDVAELRTVLARYPVEELAPWTWVLVRSEDWIPISVHLGLKPDSPAFTALDQRETFLEAALFRGQGLRSAELQREWLMTRDKLLDLAVTHEMGHALCSEPDEAFADILGKELRRGQRPRCRSSKIRGYPSIRSPGPAER